MPLKCQLSRDKDYSGPLLGTHNLPSQTLLELAWAFKYQVLGLPPPHLLQGRYYIPRAVVGILEH